MKYRPLSLSSVPGSSALRELTNLEEDWDTYGGLPPTPKALRRALRLLEAAHTHLAQEHHTAVVPYAVSPVATGGIEVEWRSGERLIRVDIGPDAELDYLIRRDSNGRREYTERHGCALDEVIDQIDEVLRS